jgi:hypothetical protein
MAAKRLFFSTVLLVLFVLLSTTGVAEAQGQPYILLTYYTAINLRDYRSAYNLWDNPPQSYQSFASGFADTAHVEPYFGALQATRIAGEMGRIPVVLLGYQTDGTIDSFFGCFTISTSNRISAATIRTIATDAVPDDASILTALAVDCTNLPRSVPTTFKDVSHWAYGLLDTYHQLLNQRDYANAYALWLQPIPDPKPNGQPAEDYRTPYNQFVNGYSDTVYINAYYGSYVEMGASAGHSYLNGVMPVVLVGQRTNGSITAYYGCFVIGAFLDGSPGIVSGRFFRFLSAVPTGNQIVQHLDIDCTSLNLRY